MGRELVAHIYTATRQFPVEERYDLTSQIRRAAISIPANIAEGAGRQTDGSFAQFLRIAIGSANELETLLILANDVQILDQEGFDALVQKVIKVRVKIHNLLAKVRPNVVREEVAVYETSEN